MADIALSKPIPNEAKTIIDLSKFEPQTENPDEVLTNKVYEHLFDVNADIPTARPVLCREGIPTLTRGNFSIASGLQGSRKTWFCLSIASAFFSEHLGFENAVSGVVLWIDTEQSPEDLKRVVDRFFRISGLPKDTDKIRFIRLRDCKPEERSKITLKAIEIFKPDLVILDGGTDLLTKGANDEAESIAAICDIMKWTESYDCHIVNVIHLTHGSEKARGHYGSEALRKCETAYNLIADGDTTNVKHVKTRNKRPDDFCFKIDENTELPILTSAPVKDGKIIKSENLFREILPSPNSCTYTELRQKIVDVKSVSDKQGQRDIKFAIDNGIIEKIGDYYSLVINNQDENNLPF